MVNISIAVNEILVSVLGWGIGETFSILFLS